MPKVEVTGYYTVTEERTFVEEMNVPQKVLDNGDLMEWLDEERNQKKWHGKGGVESEEVTLTEVDYEEL